MAASLQSAIALTVRLCADNRIVERMELLRDFWGILLVVFCSGSGGIFVPLRGDILPIFNKILLFCKY